jgi:hypothetical protein
MLFGSLTAICPRKEQVEDESKPVQGPVEGLAILLEKARGAFISSGRLLIGWGSWRATCSSNAETG